MKLTRIIRPEQTGPRHTHVVTLSSEERIELERRVRTGTSAARTHLHARILLKADAGPQGPAWTDDQIRTALEVSDDTIGRVRRAWVFHGQDAALHRRRSATPPRRKLDGRAEAQLITLACSTPPEGRSHWTMQLLADRLAVDLVGAPTVSDETVRRILKKTCSSRGR